MEKNLEYITIAIQAAVKAGKEILKIYSNPDTYFPVETKADNSPLTIADKTSHSVIQQLLQLTKIPVLSEEGASVNFSERKTWDFFWMVDPLDGTREFIKRNGEFTVNIALIKKKKPVLGIIYVPVSGDIYAGTEQTGAYKFENATEETTFQNIVDFGTKIPKKNVRKNYTVFGSRTHMNTKTENYIGKLKEQHNHIDMISMGSSLKICLVAEGIADEYPRFGPTMEWDTAAGHAIANAAGKKIWLTDFSGELTYNKENLLNPHFIVK